MPSGPYPGLRPFLDHEEILLFGRERQVREVIERLRETQFVAVIGGSGSGKSSLILAGVVPELRSFGIPGEGDFWVPLVCTPGTNATPRDQEQRLNTPITRLARKFDSLLRSRGSAQADAERRLQIADRLREERGLAKLVRLYSAELAAPPGPDPKDARFLFVIDQFEELFHPTTRKSEDARLLIERVIDHFFSPDERCHVVLTMRSEHLNDCAGFLELPDAINKASYLVRRLDHEDLRAAITRPAEGLLRLHQRADDDNARLPQAVVFEPAVVERLLADARLLDLNPDHLPLLQHVLARLWDAALQRTADRLDLPDRILGEDLAVAVSARPRGQSPALERDVNVLTASLENWAEGAYQRHDEVGRGRLDRLLRRLGVKDPNTGMYSQERLDVDAAARLLELPGGRDELQALLKKGFLGEVDYLFWDDADRERVTVKVSHESFIRGWSRLRVAIDDEAERFAVFVELLRKAGDWHRKQRREQDLLEAGDLRRVDEARLHAVLSDADERTRWFRRLESTHAFAHLVAVNDSVDAFVGASVQRQQDKQARDRRRSRNRRAVIVLTLLAVPPLLFWTLVQGPVIQRTSRMFHAGTLANSTPLNKSQVGVGSETRELEALLQAAAALDKGYQGNTFLGSVNRVLLNNLSAMPFVHAQARFVDQVVAGNEPVVNGSLRDLLHAWVWRGDTPLDGEVARSMPVPNAACMVQRSTGPEVRGTSAPAHEQVGDKSNEERAELQREVRGRMPRILKMQQSGTLITAVNPSRATDAGRALASRSVFVPDASDRAEELEIRAATVDGQGRCVSSQQIVSIPRALNPVVAFDANLRNLLSVTDEGGGKVTTIVEIDWEQNASDSSYTINPLAPVVLTGAADAERLIAAVRADAGNDPAAVTTLETHRVTAGRVFVVGKDTWRIVDELAQRVSLDAGRDAANSPWPSPFRQLKGPLNQEVAACGRLAAALAAQDDHPSIFKTDAYEDPENNQRCFIIKYGIPGEQAPAVPPLAGGMAPMYLLVAAVYPRPTDEQLNANAAMPARLQAVEREPLPAPIARMPRFGRTPDGPGARWGVGRSGTPYAGWLVSLNSDRSRQWRFVAAPWSTCALWRLGKEIYLRQEDADQHSSALGDTNTCLGQ
jgi:energy-coupling factor transporter ATP-binding protein EcfA2